MESSTEVCSVALGYGDNIIGLREEAGDNLHSSSLTIFIEDLLKQNSLKPADLSAIAVGKGPGSYTGLRIGVSVAKGLAYTLDKPLMGINTLSAMALGAMSSLNDGEKDSLLCPMLDARRMEVYALIVNNSMQELMPTTAVIVDEDSFENYIAHNKIFFFGNGMAKCKEVLSRHTNAHFIEGINPSAKNLIALATQLFEAGKTENVFTFEPYYLKDFVRTGK
ncbi:MAG: tRNA (adenosine(37)-N6)-threonylcarbamoyltransferase complex dimerization subunit type 1 TsaB [Bacteroidetes bacterium]|nr:tRNA (adenosine(37)-N6)-threonylcarbamoyltransferase complex dimerization subunit type 1 TsaB [Bacteroidota bacterium]